MTTINPDRHLTVFDPAAWNDRRIDIIGCGASGSHLAQEIARLGVPNLHLWDPDLVESHNIANQLYPLAAIGKPKAEICAALITAATGISPTIHGKCEGPADDPDDEFGDVVFLCVDTMAARRDIFRDRLNLHVGTHLVVDTRMGVDEIRLYNFCPYSLLVARDWQATLTDDSETLENACQTRTTIGATAAILAGLATHVLLQWHRREVTQDPEYLRPIPFEVMVMTRPFMINTRG